MVRGVVLETHWLIDVALNQDSGSTGLWKRAQLGELEVFIPSFCFAEAVKTLEGWRQQWRRLIQIAGDLEGRQAKLEQAEVQDRIEAAMWSTLQEVAETANSLELDSNILRSAHELKDEVELQAGDRTVLATVADAAQRNTCTAFMSKDEGFKRQDARLWMQNRGIEYFDGPLKALQHFRML